MPKISKEMVFLLFTDSFGKPSKHIHKACDILTLTGSVKNLMGCSVQTREIRIALDGFKKVYYPHMDGYSCYHFKPSAQVSPESLATSVLGGAVNLDDHVKKFDHLVLDDNHIPIRTLNRGGPHSRFIDLYELGLCGMLNEVLPIFTPPHIDLIDMANIFNGVPMEPTIPLDFSPEINDQPPTYYIIPRNGINKLRSENCKADPNSCLVPVKLRPHDDQFIGFIPAPHLMPEYHENYKEKIRAVLA